MSKLDAKNGVVYVQGASGYNSDSMYSSYASKIPVTVGVPVHPSPLYTFAGGYLDGGDNSYWDLCDRYAGKGLPMHQPLFEARADFSHGFSFAAEIQWDCAREWSHIFDFGKDAGSTNIVGLNWERDSKMGMVVCSSIAKLGRNPDFKVSWGHGEVAGVHMYPELARSTVGAPSRWLWTIDGSTGRISIFKDGHLVGEKRILNYDPSDTDRTKFLIGKSWWKIVHNHQNENFKGTITNIKIWNHCVTWDATSMLVGMAPTSEGGWSQNIYAGNGTLVSAPTQATMQKMINIKPNDHDRIMIRLDGWSFEEWSSACMQPLPPQLSAKGLTSHSWHKMMLSLQSTQRYACMVPCFPVYVLYLIVVVLTIGRLLVVPLLVAAMLPLGWIFDVHQMLLRLWLRRSNKMLAPFGIFVKFQNIKKDFDEEKYVMFAYTPNEIEKLKREPIFQRGMGLYDQEYGSARPCPIDSHRVL